MPKLTSKKTTPKSTKKPAKKSTKTSTKKSSKSAKSEPIIKLVSRARDRKVPTQRTIDVKLFG